MKSQKLGKNTSVVEVLNISRNGLWILVQDHEYLLTFKDYPWFKKATISQIHKVKLIRGHHLHWSELDIDLELESLKSPEKYPLLFQ